MEKQIFTTGVTALDNITGAYNNIFGWSPMGINTIIGTTGSGKTSLLISTVKSNPDKQFLVFDTDRSWSLQQDNVTVLHGMRSLIEIVHHIESFSTREDGEFVVIIDGMLWSDQNETNTERGL